MMAHPLPLQQIQPQFDQRLSVGQYSVRSHYSMHSAVSNNQLTIAGLGPRTVVVGTSSNMSVGSPTGSVKSIGGQMVPGRVLYVRPISRDELISAGRLRCIDARSLPPVSETEAPPQPQLVYEPPSSAEEAAPPAATETTVTETAPAEETFPMAFAGVEDKAAPELTEQAAEPNAMADAAEENHVPQYEAVPETDNGAAPEVPEAVETTAAPQVEEEAKKEESPSRFSGAMGRLLRAGFNLG
mmetsp:Transcript_25093/g.53278  ORF Transcript_25093/g.53278 Transcript_25093/m.53278 type:complete len:242 (-) Transcript_25093:16-741(-)